MPGARAGMSFGEESWPCEEEGVLGKGAVRGVVLMGAAGLGAEMIEDGLGAGRPADGLIDRPGLSDPGTTPTRGALAARAGGETSTTSSDVATVAEGERERIAESSR